MKRTRYDIADTGTSVYTGYLSGSLEYVRWIPTVDTGFVIEMNVSPNENDTGEGILVLNDTGGARAQWEAYPRRARYLVGEVVHTGFASDTGVDTEKIVGAFDTVTVTAKAKANSTGAYGGKLYVYWSEKV